MPMVSNMDIMYNKRNCLFNFFYDIPSMETNEKECHVLFSYFYLLGISNV